MRRACTNEASKRTAKGDPQSINVVPHDRADEHDWQNTRVDGPVAVARSVHEGRNNLFTGEKERDGAA